MWASIKESSRPAPNRERKIVATLLIADSKIAAGQPPFRTVRQDATAPDAILREQVRQFVPKRAIDLCGRVFAQSWI